MTSLRVLVRLLLRWLGYGVWKIDSHETLNFENLLYAISTNFQKISILNIGANDGKSFSDPLYNWVQNNPGKFRGLYLEPIPTTFTELATNMNGIPGLMLLNMAVHPVDKFVDIHQILENTGSPNPKLTGLSTVDRSRAERHSDRVGDTHVHSVRVPALSVQECLRHLESHSDIWPLVVCIDTEGLDFEIVQSLLDCNELPYIIRFEHNLCDHHDKKLIDSYWHLVSELNANGYQVFTEHNDATAIHFRMVEFVTN